jgi:hypothetical protein
MGSRPHLRARRCPARRAAVQRRSGRVACMAELSPTPASSQRQEGLHASDSPPTMSTRPGESGARRGRARRGRRLAVFSRRSCPCVVVTWRGCGGGHCARDGSLIRHRCRDVVAVVAEQPQNGDGQREDHHQVNSDGGDENPQPAHAPTTITSPTMTRIATRGTKRTPDEWSGTGADAKAPRFCCA